MCCWSFFVSSAFILHLESFFYTLNNFSSISFSHKWFYLTLDLCFWVRRIQVSFHTDKSASVGTQWAFSWMEGETPADGVWRLSRDPLSVGDLQCS